MCKNYIFYLKTNIQELKSLFYFTKRQKILNVRNHQINIFTQGLVHFDWWPLHAFTVGINMFTINFKEYIHTQPHINQ